jgi:hypothetical protein
MTFVFFQKRLKKSRCDIWGLPTNNSKQTDPNKNSDVMFLIEATKLTERKPRPRFFESIEPKAPMIKICCWVGYLEVEKIIIPPVKNAFVLSQAKRGAIAEK